MDCGGAGDGGPFSIGMDVADEGVVVASVGEDVVDSSCEGCHRSVGTGCFLVDELSHAPVLLIGDAHGSGVCREEL